MANETEMIVALVFRLHGDDEHPLPDPIAWSHDIDNVVDFLLDPDRTLIDTDAARAVCLVNLVEGHNLKIDAIVSVEDTTGVV